MEAVKYIFIWLSVVTLFIGIFTTVKQCSRTEDVTTVNDTVFITAYDTVYKDRIINKTAVKYITKTDTFYVRQDEESQPDTVFLSDFPIEHKLYIDTILAEHSRSLIDVRYSGFSASIDSLYILTEITSQRAPSKANRKRWGWNILVGPYVGYGAGILGFGPQIGVGLQFGWGYRLK